MSYLIYAILLLIIMCLTYKLHTLYQAYYIDTEKLMSARDTLALLHSREIDLNDTLLEDKDLIEDQLQQMTSMIDARIESRTKQLEAEFELQAQAIRKDAVERSRVVNKGFDGETFSPFLQKNWAPKDFRHISDPVDFLVLDGADAIRSGIADEITSITILEIKTGSADLNKVQRKIRDAIVANRVQFGIYNPDDQSIRLWSHINPKGKE